jgi:hypothetical protein
MPLETKRFKDAAWQVIQRLIRWGCHGRVRG